MADCVLGFAYNMIPTYYCIHLYIGVTCVLLLGAVDLVVLVMSVVVFSSSRFSVSGGWCWGGPLVVMFLLLLLLLQLQKQN